MLLSFSEKWPLPPNADCAYQQALDHVKADQFLQVDEALLSAAATGVQEDLKEPMSSRIASEAWSLSEQLKMPPIGSPPLSLRKHANFLALEQCVTDFNSGYPDEQGQRFLRALNIDTGGIVWEAPQPGAARAKTWYGVLATAGGMISMVRQTGASSRWIKSLAKRSGGFPPASS